VLDFLEEDELANVNDIINNKLTLIDSEGTDIEFIRQTLADI